MITPVALITARSDGAASRAEARRARPPRWPRRRRPAPSRRRAARASPPPRRAAPARSRRGRSALERAQRRALAQLFDRRDVARVVIGIGASCRRTMRSVRSATGDSAARRVRQALDACTAAWHVPPASLGSPDVSGYHHGSACLSAASHETCRAPSARRQHPAGRRRARLPAGRAVLAVRRSAGAADRRGARAARPGAGRGAVRHAAPAVLGLARVPARSTARTSSGRWRMARASAELLEIGAPPRRRYRARFYPKDALAAPRPLRHRRPLRRHRGADRRSARARTRASCGCRCCGS